MVSIISVEQLLTCDYTFCALVAMGYNTVHVKTPALLIRQSVS